MDYFASTSFSKLEELINAEKEIKEILLVPKSTVGYLVRKFRKDGILGFKRKRKPEAEDRIDT